MASSGAAHLVLQLVLSVHFMLADVKVVVGVIVVRLYEAGVMGRGRRRTGHSVRYCRAPEPTILLP